MNWFLARLILRTFLRLCAEGRGLGGWQRQGGARPRLSAWSRRTPRDGPPAAAVLNEDLVRGKCVELHPRQAAFYLHVDDGIFLSDGQRDTSRSVPLVDELMTSCAESLEGLGFRVPDDGESRLYDGMVTKTIGYAL